MKRVRKLLNCNKIAKRWSKKARAEGPLTRANSNINCPEITRVGPVASSALYMSPCWTLDPFVADSGSGVVGCIEAEVVTPEAEEDEDDKDDEEDDDTEDGWTDKGEDKRDDAEEEAEE